MSVVASSRIERTRKQLGQDRTPAYGDCLRALKKEERNAAETRVKLEIALAALRAVRTRQHYSAGIAAEALREIEAVGKPL